MFEWDEDKNNQNKIKHGVTFEKAKNAFLDPQRILVEDLAHSSKEQRWFCMGKVDAGIMTVRFTYRADKIRIYGAGYWRTGKEKYEKENQIHK